MGALEDLVSHGATKQTGVTQGLARLERVEPPVAQENPAAASTEPASAISALRARLGLAQEYVRPHPSVSSVGKPELVRGYWRDGGDLNAPDLEDPEWQGTIAEIRAQGRGNCYQASMTLMLASDRLGLTDPKIVQASVVGDGGGLEGVRYGHSWLESSGLAYDLSSGHTTIMPVETYRKLGNVENVHEYNRDQAFVAAVKAGNYGPWTDDLLKGML